MRLIIDLADWPYYLFALACSASSFYIFLRISKWWDARTQARMDTEESCRLAAIRLNQDIISAYDRIDELTLQNESLRDTVKEMMGERLGFHEERKKLAHRINLLAADLDLTDPNKKTQVIVPLLPKAVDP